MINFADGKLMDSHYQLKRTVLVIPGWGTFWERIFGGSSPYCRHASAEPRKSSWLERYQLAKTTPTVSAGDNECSPSAVQGPRGTEPHSTNLNAHVSDHMPVFVLLELCPVQSFGSKRCTVSSVQATHGRNPKPIHELRLR